MMKIVIAFVMCFLYFPFWAEAQSLQINLFSEQNGKGLEASRQILKNELVKLGHTIYEKKFSEKKCKECPQADLNIFFERINTNWLDRAPVNWFIPNPEWYIQNLKLLNQIDLILCRTHEVERIFNDMNKKTYYLDFSSRDCLDTSIEKDFRLCLHVAGGSHYKGTQAILKAWTGREDLNPLTILIRYSLRYPNQPNLQWIQERLPLADLRILQNCCGIHLCPSETEGFGHYLMEAMSTGAVVITTDAPPMNEFIDDARCLVPYLRAVPCQLATSYFVDSEQLMQKVEALRDLPIEELKKIGERNRANYLLKTEEFHQNLKRLMLQEFP
jgi:hypothetical protein